MTSYRPKTKPFAHQIRALRFLWNHEFPDGSHGGALLMAPRTGKTKTCVDYGSALFQGGKIKCAVVFAPVGVLDVWVQEIKTHSPVPARIIMWDKKGRKKYPRLPERTRPRTLYWVLINYDGLSYSRRTKSGRPSRSSGRYAIRRELERWVGDSEALCVLDESHRAKNPSAKVSRSVHLLGPTFGYRVIATGTSVTKKRRVVDVYSQWKFLNPQSELVDGHTADSFRNHYARWVQAETGTGHGYRRFLAPANVAELKQLVHEDAFAITREECFDLPPRLPPQIIHVDLTDSASAYDQMAEDMIAQIESGELTVAQIRLTQALRLRQITGGVVKTEPTEDHPEGRLVRIGSEKLDVLADLMSDLFEAEEHIVVPASFRPDISSIFKLGQRVIGKKYQRHVFQMIGGQTRTERTAAWRTFQKLDGPALIVCQPRTAALGIDLSKSHTMIWYSLTTSWVDYSQMEDRIALSNLGCSFQYLLARGTADEELYAMLQEDGDFAKHIHKRPETLRRRLNGQV